MPDDDPVELDETWPEESDEWDEWARLTPQQRWEESAKLWATYLALGGSLDPEPDTQSPFYDTYEECGCFTDGRPGVRVVRRGGV